MWIAQEGLQAPLPAGWAEATSPEGTTYYCKYSANSSKASTSADSAHRCPPSLGTHDMLRYAVLCDCVDADETTTKKSMWEHPYDQYYRDTVIKTRHAQGHATKMPAAFGRAAAGGRRY